MQWVGIEYYKKISTREIFLLSKQVYYFDKSSSIFARSSSPLKSFATTFPEASSIKVAGMDCTSY
jgi:hypothetical protein